MLLAVLAVFLMPLTSASSVTRGFSAETLSVGSELNVTLTIAVTAPDSFYIIDEIIPPGWTITNPGTGDTTQPNHIKWAVLNGATNTTLQYTTSAPNNPNTYNFTGEYGFDSNAQPATILGTTRINVTQPPVKLVFATQPSANTVVGTVFDIQPAVSITDAANSVVPASGTVTLSAFSDQNCTANATGTIQGQAIINATNGIAAFTNIAYSQAETIFLKASSGTLQTACSNATAVSNPVITGGNNQNNPPAAQGGSSGSSSASVSLAQTSGSAPTSSGFSGGGGGGGSSKGSFAIHNLPSRLTVDLKKQGKNKIVIASYYPAFVNYVNVTLSGIPSDWYLIKTPRIITPLSNTSLEIEWKIPANATGNYSVVLNVEGLSATSVAKTRFSKEFQLVLPASNTKAQTPVLQARNPIEAQTSLEEPKPAQESTNSRASMQTGLVTASLDAPAVAAALIIAAIAGAALFFRPKI